MADLDRGIVHSHRASACEQGVEDIASSGNASEPVRQPGPQSHVHYTEESIWPSALSLCEGCGNCRESSCF